MNDIAQIGKRLKGLREVLEIPIEEIAQVCETSVEYYRRIEAGEVDPSVYRMTKISRKYGISLDVLLFGEEPRMHGYFVTRKDQGLSVKRSEDYSYKSLSSGFQNAKVQPFMTEVLPLPAGHRHQQNCHDGQEFDYVLEGKLEIEFGDRTIVLEPGDSIYFDARQLHCMHALEDQPVRFLAIII